MKTMTDLGHEQIKEKHKEVSTSAKTFDGMLD